MRNHCRFTVVTAKIAHEKEQVKAQRKAAKAAKAVKTVGAKKPSAPTTGDGKGERPEGSRRARFKNRLKILRISIGPDAYVGKQVHQPRPDAVGLKDIDVELQAQAAKRMAAMQSAEYEV